MDEPMRNTRPGDPDAADGSASPSEAEWRAGLNDLICTLQRELGAALDSAREQALEAVQSIERRAEQLFAALDDERGELDRERAAEQTGREERVAALQEDIEAVEGEIRETRAQAVREADEIHAVARRRADAVITEAEARADLIIAEARERAATERGGHAPSAAPAGESAGDVQGRLRGLSDRVGRLLSSPTAGAAAAAGAATTGGLISPPPPAAPPTPPPPAEEEAAASSRGHDTGDDQSAEDVSPPAFAAPPIADAPPIAESNVAAPTSSSWFKDGLDQDRDDVRDAASDDESVTSQVPIATEWSPSDAFQELEDDSAEDAPVAEVESSDPSEYRGAESAIPSAGPSAAEPEGAPAGPVGAVTQTLIFQAVPNFQAALALERSLKAMSEVREVRVADFDERQLTFQVTHELGGQLARVLLTQRGSELDLVDARPERVEFVFRS